MRQPLLLHAPAEDELARLYWELAKIGATSVGAARPWPYDPSSREQLIALAGEMLRYDARLLSILVQWLRANYASLNPLELRRALAKARFPQALLVAMEFATLDHDDRELAWFYDYVSAGFQRVEPAERFFIDAEKPGTRSAERNLGRNLAPYARWGFVSQERPIVDPVSKQTVGRYDATTRRRILHELVERHEEFSLADYLSAVDHSISRQQARADLVAFERVRPVGRGPGARWRRRATKQVR